MAIRTYRRTHYIYLGAAASFAVASSIRCLTATCGLVLLTQILVRTTWLTLVALSTQPATVTVTTGIQSAVSPVNALRFALSALARKSGAHPWRRAEQNTTVYYALRPA